MYKKRLQVEVLLSTFVKVLHWMYDLFFLFFFQYHCRFVIFIMSFCMIFK